MEEIEIPTIVGNQGDTKAEEKKVEKKVRPVSIKTLFLRFSSKKELTCLFLGFLCTVHSVL